MGVLDYLHQQHTLAVDAETTGVRWHDRLFSIEIATREKEFHFDKRILGSEFDKLKLLFEKPRTYYLQNAKFDMRMLHWENIVLRGTILDLEVLVRLYKNDVMSTRLKDTARLFGMEKLNIVDEYISKHKLYTKRQSPHWDKEFKDLHFDRVPVDILGQYAAHDARITFDLCEKILPLIDERSREVLDNETALIPICSIAELDGCLIDRAYTSKTLDYEKGLIKDSKDRFLLAAGKIFDGSKSQLLDVFTKAGEDIPKTAKGNPCLDAAALDSFISPLAKIVQEIRFYEKRCSTYYSSFLDLCDERGRLHADMRQAGTTTGRFSYRDPNLQQLSKEDSEEDFKRPNLIRACFIPEKDHVLVQFDYAQQEYRLLLAYANQWDLIEKIMGGMDVHQATADMVGISRKHAKTLNFAVLYGSGPDNIASMLGISVDGAVTLRNKYLARLPMVQQFIATVKLTACSRGHVYNWMGRKLHLPGGIRGNAYAVPNHLIQGGGADVCKRAMVDIAPLLSKIGARLHSQIHDALVFQWPKENLDMIPEIVEVMKNAWPIKNGMEMAVDVKWSDKSLAERDLVKWQSTKNY